VAKVKFDVSGTEPEENAGKIFEEPVPGVYKAKVQACTHGFSKNQETGKPDKTRPRLEVVYEITQEGKHKGARLWDYLVFTEASAWRMDQFLQAMGITNAKKRTGEFDTDDLVGMPVKIRVAADKNEATYRPRVATVVMGSDEDAEDDEEMEELEVGDDEEIEDEEETEEETETEAEGYAEDDLSELTVKGLGDILVNEFDVERADLPKGKEPKIAMILDLQSAAAGEEEQAEADAEDAETDEDEDLDELGRIVDDEEDEDGGAQERLEELAEENDLDPNEYDTWAELATELIGLVGGDEEDQTAQIKALSLPELRAKAKELAIDSKGTKQALVDRILAHLNEEPF
jgi:hypothetical protein